MVTQRLLRVRTFRAAAAHVVAALQAHVCGQLHGSRLGTALQDMQVLLTSCAKFGSTVMRRGPDQCHLHSLTPESRHNCAQASQDLDAARAVMARYMDHALRACLLLDSPGTRQASQLLAPVLQSISACLSALSAARCAAPYCPFSLSGNTMHTARADAWCVCCKQAGRRWQPGHGTGGCRVLAGPGAMHVGF